MTLQSSQWMKQLIASRCSRCSFRGQWTGSLQKCGNKQLPKYVSCTLDIRTTKTTTCKHAPDSDEGSHTARCFLDISCPCMIPPCLCHPQSESLDWITLILYCLSSNWPHSVSLFGLGPGVFTGRLLSPGSLPTCLALRLQMKSYMDNANMLTARRFFLWLPPMVQRHTGERITVNWIHRCDVYGCLWFMDEILQPW